MRVKAHPGASQDRVERRGPDAYEVWVRAPAQEGRANAAVLALLAKELGTPRLRLVKGATSPSKIVSVR